MYHSRLLVAGCLLVFLMTITPGETVSQDKASTPEIIVAVDTAIEGKWVAKDNSKNGPIKLVKEHGNGKTTLTAYDSAGRVLYAKTSDYHTERHGNVKVLVFKNSRITAGPDAGKVDPRTRSYVYRVDTNRFYEVRGMVLGVDEPVAIAVWDRLPEPAS